MKFNIIIVFVMIIFLCLIISCGSEGEKVEMNMEYVTLDEIPTKAWEKLFQKRIIFGHHSVGRNILEGVDKISNNNPKFNINVVNMEEEMLGNGGFLGHFKVGKNRDPLSKNISFKDTIKSIKNKKIDVAFYKYCYVDFDENSDVRKLFKDYEKNISEIKQEFPDTIIVHTTVPLRTTDLKYNWKLWYNRLIKTRYWKSILKRLFNYNVVFQVDHNIKRHEFSEMIRNNYSDIDPIFDIAKIEATYPDGNVNVHEKNGEKYMSLVPVYSRDGGHLNALGKKVLSEQLLLLLVNIFSRNVHS